MQPRKKAVIALASGLALLVAMGVVCAITVIGLVNSGKWVEHTNAVKDAIARLESTSSDLERARIGYLFSGDETYLAQFRAAKSAFPVRQAEERELTRDNPVQQRLADELQATANQALDISSKSVEMRSAGQADTNAQRNLSLDYATVATKLSVTLEKMYSEEQQLLAQRTQISDDRFILVLSLFAVSFLLAIGLLGLHHRFLAGEIAERQKAEKAALDSQSAARKLSARVLRMQDEERRRFSRELHDSIGQSLAIVKLNLATLLIQNPHDTILAETVTLDDQSLNETRTLSHLLHPPLLDEVGFVSAAKWYLEGFEDRSKIKVTDNIPAELPRLAPELELALFRVLQESLTNVFRHSKASTLEVSVKPTERNIQLQVRDNGKGIPSETLTRFQSTGTHVGVGLAGMRERVREQGGDFAIESSEHGTTISVTMPVRIAVSSEDELSISA